MGNVHVNQIGNVWYEIIMTSQEWKLFKKTLLNLSSVYVRTAKNITRLIFWLTQYPQHNQTDQKLFPGSQKQLYVQDGWTVCYALCVRNVFTAFAGKHDRNLLPNPVKLHLKHMTCWWNNVSNVEI